MNLISSADVRMVPAIGDKAPYRGKRGSDRPIAIPGLEVLLWHPTGVQPRRPATACQRSDTEAGEARRRSRSLRSAGRLPAFCATKGALV
jgi:hypothetical protein